MYSFITLSSLRKIAECYPGLLKGSTVVSHWQREGTVDKRLHVVCMEGQVRQDKSAQIANLSELIDSGGIGLSPDVCSLALGRLRQVYK